LARGSSLARGTLDATRETMLPRLLAMFCVLAVFIPAFFMQGAVKALFVPLALAVGFSMVASFIFSRTLAPVLSIWLLRGHTGQIHDASFFGKLQMNYAASLRRMMPIRWFFVPVYLIVAG